MRMPFNLDIMLTITLGFVIGCAITNLSLTAWSLLFSKIDVRIMYVVFGIQVVAMITSMILTRKKYAVSVERLEAFSNKMMRIIRHGH